MILGFMDDSMVDTIEFKQWTTTDRANLETKVLPLNELICRFIPSIS